MRLSLHKKSQIVSEVNGVMEVALSAVVASLEGITANEIAILRSDCRKNRVSIYVIRNTLMYRALGNTVFECLKKVFVGSNIVAFSTVEASDCAKIFMRFSRENSKFKIKGAVFDGVFIEESDIGVLSSLPTYKECIKNLIFVIKESSVGRLIRVLNMLSHYKCK